MKSKVSYICKKKEKCLFKKIMEKHSLKTNKLDLQHKKQKTCFWKLLKEKKTNWRLLGWNRIFDFL